MSQKLSTNHQNYRGRSSRASFVRSTFNTGYVVDDHRVDFNYTRRPSDDCQIEKARLATLSSPSGKFECKSPISLISTEHLNQLWNPSGFCSTGSDSSIRALRGTYLRQRLRTWDSTRHPYASKRYVKRLWSARRCAAMERRGCKDTLSALSVSSRHFHLRTVNGNALLLLGISVPHDFSEPSLRSRA